MNSAETIHETHGGGRVGDTLPKAMGPADMAKAFQISYPTFNRREKEGVFRPFLLSRPIGRKRYSGEKVQSFLNGRGK